MNPLTDVLPAAARKYVYALVSLAAVVWGAYDVSNGDWGVFAGKIIVALTTATAASNTAGYWGGVRAADPTVKED